VAQKGKARLSAKWPRLTPCNQRQKQQHGLFADSQTATAADEKPD